MLRRARLRGADGIAIAGGAMEWRVVAIGFYFFG